MAKEVFKCIVRTAKSVLRPFYRTFYPRLRGTRWIRRVRTSNFSSGKIALGEKNLKGQYGISEDWITVDVEGADFNMDFRQMTCLPFKGNSQAVIYSSHLIEHLDQQSLINLFKECYRVLRPGGHVRVESPDLERIIDAYKNNDRPFLDYFFNENKKNIVLALGWPDVYTEDHILILGLVSCYVDYGRHIPVLATKEEFDTKLESLSIEEFGQWCTALQTSEQRMSHGHINPIYFDKLYKMLKDIGFKDITRLNNRETKIPNLDLMGIEREHRAFYSLYIEASK